MVIEKGANGRIIYIGGARGSGKSTLISKVLKRIKGRISHFQVGPEMNRISQERFGKGIFEINRNERKEIEDIILKKTSLNIEII